ncbi:MAG TPA: ATP-binding protein [Deltaproteobacteria bacterium]|nr:ATP-binding protein [Deltaproteobacteria bacterium]
MKNVIGSMQSILAIDRDKVTTDIISSSLVPEGFQVYIARGPSDGLSKFIQVKPDLVILNIDSFSTMGFMTLKDICEADPHAQVISMGMSRDDALAMECIRHGAKDYLKKPLEAKELIRSIERIETRRRLVSLTSEPDTGCVRSEQKRLVFGNDTEKLPYIINQAAYNAGAICPDKDTLKMALGEIVLNAIEHGNLNITMKEKRSATEKGVYNELLNERKSDPAYAGRVVTMDISMDREKIVYTISDQGSGFDHKTMFNTDPHAHIGSGLGMFIARSFFSEVIYEGSGNTVRLIYLKR